MSILYAVQLSSFCSIAGHVICMSWVDDMLWNNHHFLLLYVLCSFLVMWSSCDHIVTYCSVTSIVLWPIVQGDSIVPVTPIVLVTLLFSNTISTSSVMIDLLLLVVGHWGSLGVFKRQQITMRRAWTQRVKTMTRTSSNITRKWSRSMVMSCTVSGVEQEGKSQMDSLRDCLSYCSSIYTFYKYVLVWHNQW